MKNYELLMTIKPIVDNDEVQAVVDRMGEAIAALGGKITATDMLGRKKLAYTVKNFKDGFMCVIKLDLPENKVSEFRRQLSLNDNVIRTMFLESSKVKA